MSAGHKRGKEIRRMAAEMGWVELPRSGKSNHVKFRHPVTGHIVSVPGTPSDVRSFHNVKALLRRLSTQMRPQRPNI